MFNVELRGKEFIHNTTVCPRDILYFHIITQRTVSYIQFVKSERNSRSSGEQAQQCFSKIVFQI